ncbi:ATP-binding protein [Deinococcus sp. MIMF12]|uniref:ATP-binding protein n=1 Tax=Deinococcus rhizophilus TaxID=3049544 RepID=A0ABT7JI99_9DEIO|nr:ATP-binding protein [Deinococcus rhizophilus]MDL2344788.1 ATP-binding protein [Deinococcus rhizophilus]
MAGILLPFQTASADDQNIYTYEGWRAYVDAPTLEPPPRMTRAAYEALSTHVRAEYDEARRLYIMRFGPLNTPDMQVVKLAIKEQLEANIRAPRHQVKVGLVVDGHANLGKTTIAKAVGRQFERRVRGPGTVPDPRAHDEFVPVVHVTLQRDTTPKGLAQAICDYLHVPHRRDTTEPVLVRAIYRAVERHRILLFVVDDIHFLQARSRGGQETSNFMKSLMTITGATFVYVGVDVEQMGVLQEHGTPTLASSQTASRFIHLPVRPMEKGSEAWRRLLRAVEGHLPLLDHEAGTLERCADLLYSRTGGSVGPLMNLLRTTALRAVGGEERLDHRALRAARMDYRSTMEGNLEDGDAW